jgi:hypothetical protein
MCENGRTCAPASTVASFSTQCAPIATPSPRRTVPSNTHPTSIATSAAAVERAADVDAIGIGESTPGVEQRIGLRALIQPLEHGELAHRVDAERLDHVRRARRSTGRPFLARERDHVGQVILAGRIAVADRGSHRAKHRSAPPSRRC